MVIWDYNTSTQYNLVDLVSGVINHLWTEGDTLGVRVFRCFIRLQWITFALSCLFTSYKADKAPKQNHQTTRNKRKNTLLWSIPTLTHYSNIVFECVWHIIWKYLWHICMYIFIYWHSIWHSFWHSIFDMFSGIYVEIFSDMLSGILCGE